MLVLSHPSLCHQPTNPKLNSAWGFDALRAFLDFILKALKKFGYVAQWKILNTMDFGAPQQRARWYLVAIREDCVRQRVAADWFPRPLPCLSLARIVKPLPDHRWMPAPAKEDANAHANVMAAYKALKEKGINAFTKPVIIDTGCSARFRTYRVSASPCITHTRGSQLAYWCSTKGGRLTVSELGRLQGFGPNDIDWKGAGLTAHQYGGMLGNAQSLCVVEALLPYVLYASKIIDTDDFQLLMAQC